MSIPLNHFANSAPSQPSIFLMPFIPRARVLILDFGSQFTQLIARRIRQMHVYCEIMPYDVDLSKIIDFAPAAVILSGGPNSVNQDDAPTAPIEIFNWQLPILGVCYGMQTMAKQLGGKVKSNGVGEFGYAQIILENTRELSSNHLMQEWFEGINILADDFAESSTLDSLNSLNSLDVWMSHGDYVEQLPSEFIITANTKDCPIAAMQHLNKPWFGIQFHAEVTHTKWGEKLLMQFVLNVANIQPTWQMNDIKSSAIKNIQKQVGDSKVLLGLSGGVDSSVAAALIHQAIGDQLICVFVDHGLLRHQERQQVEGIFSHLGVHVIYVDAREQFLKALEGVSDPEAKRKIIGKLFIDVFNKEAQKLTNVKFLAQGTIYPDVIESAGKHNKTAHTIKSHHNVGGLPDDLPFELLEPLRTLFKDEVRELGLNLGLPHQLVYRHPFPGPGLGVRILGEIKAHYIELLQKADAIFIEILREKTARDIDAAYGLCRYEEIGKTWYDLTSQAFAVFLPVKSVGVMGDGRTYDYVVALRAVQTTDFMTAHWARLPYDLLAEVSNRIINEIKGLNRVVYDVSGKPPATIEWE
jgi:GMP synthase (glutamine-hydrolysing)